MAINTPHPLYINRADEWRQMRHTFAGQRAVKEQTTMYLPATSGMEADGMAETTQPGWKRYNAYLTRAIFHDLVREAVQTLSGVLHLKSPHIEVPVKLEKLLESCTPTGESLEMLLREINVAQLLFGRIGLQCEVPTGKGPDAALPFILKYPAESILNWDTVTETDATAGSIPGRNLAMVVLDESRFIRDGFDWTWGDRYRLLALYEGKYIAARTEDAGMAELTAMLESPEAVIPSVAGRDLDYVPFFLVNANDLNPEPETPPLIGLSDLALAIYRGEADYRQTLFAQAQETLVVIGEDEDDKDTVRTGAGATIRLPLHGDAKYIGVSASGLGEMRQAIEGDKNAASDRGARLLDINSQSGSGGGASGEALRIRVAARTTTLSSVARTGAEGLRQTLRAAAEWVGADPELVVVEPNIDFVAGDDVTGQDMLSMMQARVMGLPLSLRSIHQVLVNKEVTTKTYEEELEEIDQEEPLPGTEEGDPETEEEDEDNPQGGNNDDGNADEDEDDQ